MTKIINLLILFWRWLRGMEHIIPFNPELFKQGHPAYNRLGEEVVMMRALSPMCYTWPFYAYNKHTKEIISYTLKGREHTYSSSDNDLIWMRREIYDN